MQAALFDRIFYQKLPLGRREPCTGGVLGTLLGLTVLAIWLRSALLDFESADYRMFLQPWFEEFCTGGGFRALARDFSDYTPPYLYILAALSYLPFSALYAIKTVSILFDFILALSVLRFLYRESGRWQIAVCGYAAVLFAPTLFLNSALWGQCDGIYTALLVLAVFAALREKPAACAAWYAAALSFKLQAVFLAPLLIFLWMKGRLRLRHFLLIPAVLFASVLPAWAAGRPLKNLLTIYCRQTDTYRSMSLSAPNLWAAIGSQQDELAAGAVFLCAAVILVSLYLFYAGRVQLTVQTTLGLALFFALLVPFLLPHMHERYFYPADVFSLLYAFTRPRRAAVPLLVCTASFAVYLPYLFSAQLLPLPYAALLMAAALAVVLHDLLHAPQEPQPAAA